MVAADSCNNALPLVLCFVSPTVQHGLKTNFHCYTFFTHLVKSGMHGIKGQRWYGVTVGTWSLSWSEELLLWSPVPCQPCCLVGVLYVWPAVPCACIAAKARPWAQETGMLLFDCSAVAAGALATSRQAAKEPSENTSYGRLNGSNREFGTSLGLSGIIQTTREQQALSFIEQAETYTSIRPIAAKSPVCRCCYR